MVKPLVSILALSGTILIGSLASGQVANPTGRIWLLSPPSGSIPNGVPSPSVPGSTTNYLFRIPGTNTPPLLRAPTNNVGQLKPGVYETFPYTCIVVVPGAQPDDKCIIGGSQSMIFRGQSGERMPTMNPDLQFIPRTAKRSRVE